MEVGIYFVRHMLGGVWGSDFLPSVFIKNCHSCRWRSGELRPQTQHYSCIFRDFTFKLKIKNKKETVTKIKSQTLWALISIKTGYNGL